MNISTLYVIKKLQILTVVRCHYMSTRITEVQSSDNINWWWGHGENEKYFGSYRRQASGFLLNMLLPYDPGIYVYVCVFFYIYNVHTKICTRDFIEAIYVKSKAGSKPKYYVIDK